MAYAKVKDTVCYEYPYGFQQLQADNPYTNFGSNQDVAFWFPQTNEAVLYGYELADVLGTQDPPYDPVTQYLVQGAPEYVDGVWKQTWIVETYTPEQQVIQNEKLTQQNKQQAESLLSQTDWTAIPSVSDPAQSNPYLTNQNAFLVYRSQIRAIAVNPPVVVSKWPAMPVEVWETVPTA